MHCNAMTPRKLHSQTIYLEPDKAEALDALSGETRIAKAVLLREAVDDLLLKHRTALLQGFDSDLLKRFDPKEERRTNPPHRIQRPTKRKTGKK